MQCCMYVWSEHVERDRKSDLSPLEDTWELGSETLEGLDPCVDCRVGMGRYPDVGHQGK